MNHNRHVADVLPFRGLRYDERVAGPLGALISPPYDVISPEQREALLARDPRSFVRIELPEPTPEGHAVASDRLREWRHDGTLRAEPRPAVYLDEHSFVIGTQRVTRTELIVALRLYEPSAGVVLPHERTFPKAKAERLELLRATRANTSPVFGMFDDRGAIAALRAVRPSATASTQLGDEEHRLAVIDDARAIQTLREALAGRRVYIADGHHRYETALTYADERGAADGAPERHVLAALCALDDPGLRIFATHRVVRGGDAAIDAAVARSFDATEVPRDAVDALVPSPSGGVSAGSGIVLARGGHFLRLEPRGDADLSSLPPSWRTLPVAIAEQLLVKPLPASAQVSYEHDTAAAIAASRAGATAVLLRAVDPATLRAVADSGERMPQKTTYFYPKVPAGLVVRSLDLE